MVGSSFDSSRHTKVSNAELQAILDRLDQTEQQNPSKNKRTSTRISFRKNDVLVRVHHPGGSITSNVVFTRNLSAGGLSLIYPGFLHVGTKVEIRLKRRFASDDLIRGTVQYCQLVDKRFHQIGVKFDKPINPKIYLDPSEWGELEDLAPVEREQLCGTVLHLDDQEIERMLVQHYLKGTRVRLISCANIPQAREAVLKNKVDCILCDLVMDGGGGEKAIETFRQEGFVGPIALVTASTDPDRIKKANDAGASALLAKPFGAEKLASLLAAWLITDGPQLEPIPTTLTLNPGLTPLVEQYVARIRNMGRELYQALEKHEIETVRRICQTIERTATGFGFATIAELAKQVSQRVDSPDALSTAGYHIRELVSACFRVVAHHKSMA